MQTFSFETVGENVLFTICAFKLAAKIYEEVEQLNVAFLSRVYTTTAHKTVLQNAKANHEPAKMLNNVRKVGMMLLEEMHS